MTTSSTGKYGIVVSFFKNVDSIWAKKCSPINGKYIHFVIILSYIEMDLYNQHLIPTTSSHTAQQVGFNSFPPNSAVPTLPLQSEKHHLAWWRTWSGVGPGVKIQIRRIANHYNQIAMVLASKRSWKLWSKDDVCINIYSIPFGMVYQLMIMSQFVFDLDLQWLARNGWSADMCMEKDLLACGLRIGGIRIQELKVS